MRQIGVGDFTVTPKMRENVLQVLDTERISYGPFCQELERRFAVTHGATCGVLSNSGTSSLQVALAAMKEIYGWADGDEVIVPAVTFVATVNIVLQNGMKPVLVDVEPDYYDIMPALVERAITPRTRCIIPVHLFGLPCDMPKIMDVADRHGLKVIEDSCECVGATINGKPVGSWGDIGCFSFYVAHIICAGVGGIGITRDPQLAAVMRSLVNHGRDGIYTSISDDDGLVGARLQEVILRRFNFERIGYSYRITELEAALALAQLDDLADNLMYRRINANRLFAGLQGIKELQLPKVWPNATHSWMMFPLVVKNGSKWPLCNYLEEHGIETREMLPLTNQPCYKGMFDPTLYPVADWLNHSGFYIGCMPSLDESDMDYIADAIKEFYGR